MDSVIKDKALALDRGGQRIEAVKLLRQHLPIGTELAEVVELLTHLRTLPSALAGEGNVS